MTLHAKALNNKLQADIAILDLSKAFDRVSHMRLLCKTESGVIYIHGYNPF